MNLHFIIMFIILVFQSVGEVSGFPAIVQYGAVGLNFCFLFVLWKLVTDFRKSTEEMTKAYNTIATILQVMSTTPGKKK